MLVGTKSDLRLDQTLINDMASNGQSLISKEEAEDMARLIGAVKYLECSARTSEGVKV